MGWGVAASFRNSCEPIFLVIGLILLVTLSAPAAEAAIVDDGGETCYPRDMDCAGTCFGDAVVDCAGVCGGSAYEDSDCGCVTDASGTNFDGCGCGVAKENGCCPDAPPDCNGDCGGTAVEDCEGTCQGTAVEDCNGDCGGTAVEDCAGDCGGTAVEDCNGDCGGTAVEDCNGDCGGSATKDCEGTCDGPATTGDCGCGVPPENDEDGCGCGGGSKDANGCCAADLSWCGPSTTPGNTTDNNTTNPGNTSGGGCPPGCLNCENGVCKDGSSGNSTCTVPAGTGCTGLCGGKDDCGNDCPSNCGNGETCSATGTCVKYCAGGGCGTKTCGTDACGNPCGTCDAPGTRCDNGACVSCGGQNFCAGRQCGSDGCGNTCGSGSCSGNVCSDNGQCCTAGTTQQTTLSDVQTAPWGECINGKMSRTISDCDVFQTPLTCASGTDTRTSTRQCTNARTETSDCASIVDPCKTNAWDDGLHPVGDGTYVYCGDAVASGGENSCTPECAPGSCGPSANGCGDCGMCAGAGELCMGGKCTVCTPTCGIRECGTEPTCNTICGPGCSADQVCNAEGRCVASGEDCTNGRDDDGDRLIDEEDDNCGIRLIITPMNPAANAQMNLSIAPPDGVWGTARMGNICASTCAAGNSGACSGALAAPSCANTRSCLVTAPASGAKTYYACLNRSRDSGSITVNAPPNQCSTTACQTADAVSCTNQWCGKEATTGMWTPNACAPYPDYRFLCYNRAWYSCGNQSLDPGYTGWGPWSTYKRTGDRVGNFCCDQMTQTWSALKTYYRDVDGDGCGNPAVSLRNCTVPAGYVENRLDCNDGNPNICGNKNEALFCSDGLDNNCDGEADFDGYTSNAVPPNYGGRLDIKGDRACNVSIDALTGPAYVADGASFTIVMTATAKIRNTTFTTLGVACNPAGGVWAGNSLTIACTAGVLDTADTYAATINARVNTNYSYSKPPTPVSSRTLSLTIVNCDQDGDGYNRSFKPAGVEICALSGSADCIDTNASVNPAAIESIASNTCADTFDNDCDGGYDYDGFTGGRPLQPAPPGGVLITGDDQCPVGATAASAPGPSCYGPAGLAQVNCTYTVGGVRSGIAFINFTDSTGASFRKQCVPASDNPWLGNNAVFNCSTATGVTIPSATFNCSVNRSISTQTGTDRFTTVPLVGPQQLCDTGCGVCDDTGVCRNNVTWNGVLNDGRTRQAVNVRGNVTWDATTTATNATGGFSVPNVPVCPNHNITGAATGYDPTFEPDIKFNRVPFNRNITLWPPTCKPDCTLGGACNYACIGQNGCELPSNFTAAERTSISALCQDAAPGSVRGLNNTHMIRCCAGPVLDRSAYSVPLTLESCTERVIPHKTIVSHEGRIVQLTVATFEKCEE